MNEDELKQALDAVSPEERKALKDKLAVVVNTPYLDDLLISMQRISDAAAAIKNLVLEAKADPSVFSLANAMIENHIHTIKLNVVDL